MLDKKYNHKMVEKGKYEEWKSKDYFKSGDRSKKPYCIVIPPPNVTGKLHLGHAWDTTLQDIMIRYKRMCGYDALWLPGMDHAAIATEAKVVKRLKEQGIDKYECGREKFLEACWDWTHEYSDNIREQWAKLGLSVDYSKERFTLDEGLSKTVRKVFVDMYHEGLIYRGERIINWDPVAKTALSNEEVIYKEDEGALYHIKYYLEDRSDYLSVATTRPETLFGDTAVIVNPDDDRYKDYIGKKVILPVVNKLIPVIGDSHADMEFGTGVVKITPAHDPNDFEVGNRHHLERVVVMNSDATMNTNALQYEGMSREACREALVKDLERDGLLIRVEKMVHSVGHSERTDAVVEPYLSKQWFVKMRPLADKVLENQKDKDKKVHFVPPRYEKIMNHWMEITYDWCISRQLWWGHQIPAWYRGEEIYVGMEQPEGDGWKQDEDVLDTWFSSALWPFSTLDWAMGSDDFSRYYPNDVLVTGYDIIPFWVNRMTFQGLHFTGKRPFKDCLIHGLIRDKDGRKMSKSLGNGVDPMDVIEEYGCDALRFFLATSSALGTDLRYDSEKVKSSWNFINKIWNASRYVLMNIGDLREIQLESLRDSDKWILSKYERVLSNCVKHMEKYEFNIIGDELYDFIWNDFCSSYIELSKFSSDTIGTKSTLGYVLMGILKMLHPFMPFVTEEIYQMMPNRDRESIMISQYSVVDKRYVFGDVESKIDKVLEFITLFRNRRLELGIGHAYEVQIQIDDSEIREMVVNMLKLEGKECCDCVDKRIENVRLYDMSIDIVYDNSENMALVKEGLEKEREGLIKSIERREKLLANENYVRKAPEVVVNGERENLRMEQERLRDVLAKLRG